MADTWVVACSACMIVSHNNNYSVINSTYQDVAWIVHLLNETRIGDSIQIY